MSRYSCRRCLDLVSGKARNKGTLFRKTLLDILSLVIGKLRSQEPHTALDVTLMSAQVREISFSHEHNLRSRRSQKVCCMFGPASATSAFAGTFTIHVIARPRI